MDKNTQNKNDQDIKTIRTQIKDHKSGAVEKLKKVQKLLECDENGCRWSFENGSDK